jgi:nucleoside-diphosphate-sugar epimerase
MENQKKVMVSGATGYVAGWIVKKLLDEGYHVNATVRNPNDQKKVSHLLEMAKNAPGTLELFKADLLQPGSFADAMKGCSVVFHTASPYILGVKDPQKELIEPAVNGTQYVLDQVNKTPEVQRVVLTSSCAAIYTDAIDCQKAPNGVLTEEVWNTTASLTNQPYSYSKTLAEQKAWEMAEKQTRWDLVVLNPSAVFGPILSSSGGNSESLRIMTQFGDGTLRFGAPKLGIGAVDVRDLAEAHFQAAVRPEAQGRYIINGYNTNFFELASSLRSKYGKKYPLPKSVAPKWLLKLVGPLMNKALTKSFIEKNVDVAFNADNAKSKKALGLQYRPMQEMMEDGFESLIQFGLLPKK